jgi:hypothetical protein
MAEKTRLVDDEATILLSRAFLIKRADHEFFTASDGKITLEKKSPFQPYLDAPDINGPKLTGHPVSPDVGASPVKTLPLRVLLLQLALTQANLRYQRQLPSLALESRHIGRPNEVNGCVSLTAFLKESSHEIE